MTQRCQSVKCQWRLLCPKHNPLARIANFMAIWQHAILCRLYITACVLLCLFSLGHAMKKNCNSSNKPKLWPWIIWIHSYNSFHAIRFQFTVFFFFFPSYTVGVSSGRRLLLLDGSDVLSYFFALFWIFHSSRIINFHTRGHVSRLHLITEPFINNTIHCLRHGK